MPSILSDNFSGTYTACRISLNGDTNTIGIINGNSRYTDQRTRAGGAA